MDEDDDMSTGNFSLDVYREHLKVRQIVISGVVDDSMIDKVTLQIAKLNEMDEDRERVDKTYDRRANPITLKIVSPGGYVSVGLGIVSQIVQSETPIIGYAIGDVASMATTILAACHVRLISRYARVMVHSVSGGYLGKFIDMVEHLEEVKRLQVTLDGIMVERTRITQKMLDEVHANRRDWYMSSAEALELGIVDDIMPVGLEVAPLSTKKVKAAKKSAPKG